ncbi:MAG: ROK family transcriptional regulator [Pedococcus sp.]
MHPQSLSPSATTALRTLLVRGSSSRIGLARATGLTPGGVTRAVQPLIKRGLVTEDATLAGVGRGRPAQSLSVVADRELQVGVKVTASELISVVCDLRCNVLAQRTEPLRNQAPEAVSHHLAAVIAAWRESFPAIVRVGVAISGDVDSHRGQVGYSPFLGWRDVPLGHLVAARTGLHVVVENDVRALLTGEHLFGARSSAESLAMVTIGAGIGCALLLQGRVVRSSRGVLGEIGHVLADSSGPMCHCGNIGCVEAIAGEAAIVSSLARRGYPNLDIHQVLEMARADHPAAREVLAEAGRAIGIGLATLANLFGPAVIVLTGEAVGGPDGDYEVMEPSIRETFAQRAFGSAADCELVLQPLGLADWARGAAACAVAELVTL